MRSDHSPPILGASKNGKPRLSRYTVSVRCSGGDVVDVVVAAASKIEAPRFAFDELRRQGLQPQETKKTAFVEREVVP